MPEAQTVLAQILRMVPRTEFEKLARQHGGENRVRSFPCWSQFACLVYAQLSRQTSLRDLVLALETKKPLLYHCLGTTEVRSSTPSTPVWSICASASSRGRSSEAPRAPSSSMPCSTTTAIFRRS